MILLVLVIILILGSQTSYLNGAGTVIAIVATIATIARMITEKERADDHVQANCSCRIDAILGTH